MTSTPQQPHAGGDRARPAPRRDQAGVDPRHKEMHRDVQGGEARAAVFGVSDGLVSNVSLVVGVAGASIGSGPVLLAGIAGLVAGAISMAAGEYVSMKAQSELFERELQLERDEIIRNPEGETRELADIYTSRGMPAAEAMGYARTMMADLDVAVETHAREELGIDPHQLGSPVGAALSSFVAFAVGALLPILPWFFLSGLAAVIASVVTGVLAAVAVGAAIGQLSGRGRVRPAVRQAVILVLACAVTYGVGALVGVSLA